MFTVSEFSGTDPFANLAMEEWLTRAHDGTGCQLLFYRNTPAVVIGRNQNPWCECDPGSLRGQGIPLLRRISGGGTVYHDPGNLNYAFILPRQDYCPEKYVGMICQALQAAGVPAEQNDRHDILLNGKKISGTAYMLSSRTALHHGTLLVEADLNRLRQTLRVSPVIDIETRAITSVRSSVTNVRDWIPDFSIDTFKRVLVAALRHIQERPVATHADKLPKDVQALMCQRQEPEWIFGRTPPFSATVKPSDKTPWGFSAKKGMITAVEDAGSAWLRPEAPLIDLLDTLTALESGGER